MRRWMKGVLVVIGLTAWSAALARTVGRSLDIQPGARQNGMGAAGVALESDPADDVWWNPAALGYTEWHSVELTRGELLPGRADTPYHFAAAAGRVVPRFGIGLSFTYVDYDGGSDPSGSVTPATQRELSGAFSAGYRVAPDLSFGVTAKYVDVNLAPYWGTGTGWAFDLGWLHRRTISNVRMGLGFNVQNLGRAIANKGLGTSYPLNRNLKLGGSAAVPLATRASGSGVDATAVLDWDHLLTGDDHDALHAGAEVAGQYHQWARVAVRLGHYDDWEAKITDWTWGAGVRVWGISLDYAQIPQRDDNPGVPNVEKWTYGMHTDALASWLSAR